MKANRREKKKLELVNFISEYIIDVRMALSSVMEVIRYMAR